MSYKFTYFRLGVFIIVSLALLFGGIVALGVGSYFQPKFLAETYLNESVQGLDVGSPVKLRGVQVGNITHIGFVSSKYGDPKSIEERFVLIEMRLTRRDIIGSLTREEAMETLEREISRGLRIRVAPSGLTGTAYLEMDYVNPDRYPPPVINWTPQYPFIPSAPGAITRLEDTFESLSKTLASLEQVRVEDTVRELDELLVATRRMVQGLNIQSLTSQGEALLAELRVTNKRVSDIIGEVRGSKGGDRLDVARVMEDLSQASRSLKTTAENLDKHLSGDGGPGALDNFSAAVADIRQATRELPGTLAAIRDAAKDAPQAVGEARILFTRLAELVNRQSDEIDSMMRNLEQASRNIKDATSDAKRYPSYFLFGAPPTATEQ